MKEVTGIHVPTDTTLEEGLLKSLGYYKEGQLLNHASKSLNDKDIEGLAVSSINSLSCIISKINGMEVLDIEDDIVEDIKSCFQKVVPWNKAIKQVIKKRFEIIGIPKHLWNDLIILKLASCLGEVVDIHLRKHSFSSNEVSFFINDNMELAKRVTLKEGSNTYNTWIQEIKTKEVDGDINSELEIS